MTRPIARTELSGGEQAQWGLLALCLFILAAGTTLPQRLAGMNSIINYSPSESLYGVLSAGVMIFACIILVLWNASRRGGRAYRPTGIEAGLGLLLAAGLLGIFLASDKRTAVNHLVFIIAPMFMGILLVQLLDSAAKVKVLLYTMVALGIVNTYECADQFFFSNEVMVQQYKEDPLAMLAKVGIQPDSYQHMMFEHHLKSRDVRGFFSTSNSSGSFLLLALFAAMALIVEGRSLHLSGRATVGEMVGKYLALAAVAFGLLLTQSKGAIGSAIISCVLLLVWHLFRDWLTRHRTATVLCAAATVVAVWTGIIAYGTTHDTLPGGKSMLVRWQYWTGAARMYADHPLGVGGGNFAVWYPTYKIPAAPETVKDPHNFVLSFLTQYGPL
ncbi:MAG TPA: O-antigen ligase family protein, partial [Sedimentisphaerales bacterium]|nr:O-antigen ligase family protein [Sedimentisphaerales bacterium]